LLWLFIIIRNSLFLSCKYFIPYVSICLWYSHSQGNLLQDSHNRPDPTMMTQSSSAAMDISNSLLLSTTPITSTTTTKRPPPFGTRAGKKKTPIFTLAWKVFKWFVRYQFVVPFIFGQVISYTMLYRNELVNMLDIHYLINNFLDALPQNSFRAFITLTKFKSSREWWWLWKG
jgi:hypothetical protein